MNEMLIWDKQGTFLNRLKKKIQSELEIIKQDIWEPSLPFNWRYHIAYVLWGDQ